MKRETATRVCVAMSATNGSICREPTLPTPRGVRTVMAETAAMRITVARESGLWAFTHLQWELEDVEVRERGEHDLRKSKGYM